MVGPSGAGKSTLLSLLGLLDRPTNGEITISGERVDHLGSRQASRVRREKIGFLFQNVHLLLGLTAFENVMMALRYSAVPRPLREQKVSSALEQVGLAHKQQQRSADLSGGERQRVALARAVVREPALLLCDEPTGSLDPANAELVAELLRAEAARARAVLVVTHSPELAAQSSRIVELREGRVAP